MAPITAQEVLQCTSEDEEVMAVELVVANTIQTVLRLLLTATPATSSKVTRTPTALQATEDSDWARTPTHSSGPIMAAVVANRTTQASRMAARATVVTIRTPRTAMDSKDQLE